MSPKDVLALYEQAVGALAQRHAYTEKFAKENASKSEAWLIVHALTSYSQSLAILDGLALIARAYTDLPIEDDDSDEDSGDDGGVPLHDPDEGGGADNTAPEPDARPEPRARRRKRRGRRAEPSAPPVEVAGGLTHNRGLQPPLRHPLAPRLDYLMRTIARSAIHDAT